MVNRIKVDSIFPDKSFLGDLVFDGFKLKRKTKSVCLENCGEIAINVTFKKIQDDADSAITMRPPKLFFFNKNLSNHPWRSHRRFVNFCPNQVGVFQEKLVLVCSPPFNQQCEICICLVGQCKKKYRNDDELMILKRTL